ncbi:MAG: hypothetical protein EXR11_10450 [Rhodospirillaceae bacterium]|nr:hypothetical protein [Rhodospirillaceae bacterium]
MSEATAPSTAANRAVSHRGNPLIQKAINVVRRLVCVVTGMGLGADLALPPALQADVVDFDILRNRQKRAGLFFAMWSMSTKFALALAVHIKNNIAAIKSYRINIGHLIGQRRSDVLNL